MNKLFYGDNLEVLRRDIKDESVDLCYIDPPFNSKRNYNQIYNNIGSEDRAQAQAFIDTWEWDDNAIDGLNQILSNHLYRFTLPTINLINGLDKVLGKGSLFAYLIHMTLRIAEIYRVLKPTGSFYLHCDPSASHYLKIILDSVFCSRSGDFKNEIIWRRHYSHNDGNKFGCIHDVIFYYVKSNTYTYNRQNIAYDDEYIKKNYAAIDVKTGKRYRSVSLNAAGQGTAKYFGDKLLTPPNGTHWRWSQENINDAIEKDILFFTKNGVPRYKQFLDNMEGVPVQDTWTDFYSLSSHDSERLGYPTQKPEALLERIIKASSNEGDIVLDIYCGCGTTVAVAERLNRDWIGIDITYQSISLILKRLEDTRGKTVLNNILLSGIPKDYQSAYALAHRKDDKTRKEFEKWAVLSYSNNKAFINEKKGGDGGIDGMAVLIDNDENGNQVFKDVLFSVKSDREIKVAYIRDFFGVITRDKAAMGYFICLNKPNDNIYQECKKYGKYVSKAFHTEYPIIEIITVDDILNGKILSIPTSQQIDVVKAAKAKSNNNQIGLF